MADRKTVIEYAEKFMKDRNIPIDTAKIEGQDSWVFSCGTIKIQVRINAYSQAGKTGENVAVAGLIMKVPDDAEKELALYRELLSLNNQFHQIAFAVTSQKLVVLTTSREIDNLQYDEFVNMVDNVAYTGDGLDERLKSKFS